MVWLWFKRHGWCTNVTSTVQVHISVHHNHSPSGGAVLRRCELTTICTSTKLIGSTWPTEVNPYMWPATMSDLIAERRGRELGTWQWNWSQEAQREKVELNLEGFAMRKQLEARCQGIEKTEQDRKEWDSQRGAGIRKDTRENDKRMNCTGWEGGWREWLKAASLVPGVSWKLLGAFPSSMVFHGSTSPPSPPAEAGPRIASWQWKEPN